MVHHTITERTTQLPLQRNLPPPTCLAGLLVLLVHKVAPPVGGHPAFEGRLPLLLAAQVWQLRWPHACSRERGQQGAQPQDLCSSSSHWLGPPKKCSNCCHCPLQEGWMVRIFELRASGCRAPLGSQALHRPFRAKLQRAEPLCCDALSTSACSSSCCCCC